mgnify:FL=1
MQNFVTWEILGLDAKNKTPLTKKGRYVHPNTVGADQNYNNFLVRNSGREIYTSKLDVPP